MPDFWRSSGYHLLEPAAQGRLAVTDAFLRAYFLRPEIQPVAESCAAERRLHASLLEAPRRAVSTAELAALADPDARENYALVLAFRDRAQWIRDTLTKGMPVEVIGYLHEREIPRRDGTCRTIQEIYATAIKPR